MIRTRPADLHIHTRCSDGSLLPEQAARKGELLGLSCIALTDHDTVAGIAVARRQLAETDADLVLISGTELSSYDPQGREAHILAYGFDEEDPAVLAFLERQRNERVRRTGLMLERLAALGMPLDFAEVTMLAGGGSLGRPHVARALAQRGYVANTAEAFEKLIGEGLPAYVPKLKTTPGELIEEIHRWGGLAVLAHPARLDDGALEDYAELGIDGFEAFHPLIPNGRAKEIAKLARRLGLLVTGGSDTHGMTMHSPSLGEKTVPFRYVRQLLARLGIADGLGEDG